MTTLRSEVDRARRRSADETTATALKLFVVLVRAYTALARRTEADVVRHGLTTAEFAVLEALYHKGPMLLGELQRGVLVSSGGMTFLVDRLVRKKLVERRACETDRRARYAALTEAGEKLIDRIFPDHERVIADAMSGLSIDEQKVATELLKRLGKKAAADDTVE